MIGGKYRIGRTIAVGGMGVVYEAINVRTSGKVALKVLSEEAQRNEASRMRFAREARASGRLRSRHVARVLDVDALDDQTPYIVMELLDGQDLSREIKARPPLPLAEAASIVVQVAAGIAEAHAAGIVHRDLKPGNVFLANEGAQRIAKVLDFGISKVPVDGEDASELTCTFATVGTPAYMSPEQIRRPRDVDSATDVWSLGVLLYRLLAGKVPFTGNASSVAVSICNDTPLPLSTVRDDVPEDVVRIIDAALQKDKTFRPTIAELADVLALHLGDDPSAPVAREALSEIHHQAGAAPKPTKKAPVALVAVPAPLDETLLDPQAMTPMSPARAPSRMLWLGALLAVVALTLGALAIRRTEPTSTRSNAGRDEAPTSVVVPAATSTVGEGVGSTGSAAPIATAIAPGTTAATASVIASGAKPGVVYTAQPPRPKPPTIHATASAAPLPPRL